MPDTDTTTITPTGGGDDARDDRRAEVSGLSVGAVCFGWLVSVAMPVLLAGLTAVLAAGVGVTMDVTRADARGQAAAIGLTAGMLMLVYVAIGYFAGGYVAGRMTRVDAARQGVGVWCLSLLVSMAVSVAGVALGTRYDVFGLAPLVRPDSALDGRGIFAFAVVALTTLLLAVLGARTGQRYHTMIDEQRRDANA